MAESAHPNYRIVPYDARWPVIFREEQRAIAAALGHQLDRIEHIGSTAVPGLGSKPIVDIMLGALTASDFERCVAGLATLGYEHRGDTAPGALYNRKQGPPRINAHLTVFGGDFWLDHLVFRDHLRAHAETARAYEALKRQILFELGPDPPAYNAAKEAFIVAVLRAAKRHRFAESTVPE